MTIDIDEIEKRIRDAGLDPLHVGRYQIQQVFGETAYRSRQIAIALRKRYPYAGPVKPDPIDPVEEHKLKRRVRELEKDLSDLLTAQEKNVSYQEFIEGIATALDQHSTPPKWTIPGKGKKVHAAAPTAFLSDTHWDEVVEPSQVNFVNAYNRKIAERRLINFFDNTVELATKYLAGLEYRGICVPLGGDLFSGFIHDELTETNEATMIQSVLYWLDPMEAGLRMLAGQFGNVYLPCVVGNHPRSSKKPRSKFRAQDNFDYLFYYFLARLLSNDKRIRFDIAEAAEMNYRLLNTTYMLTHGDAFRGGSGISGLFSPLLIGDARARKTAAATRRPYDVMIMGHWHSLKWMGTVIVNGSVKGYDEYAATHHFEFEAPRQAFWLTDAEHGVTIQAPIHVQSPNEKWMPR